MTKEFISIIGLGGWVYPYYCGLCCSIVLGQAGIVLGAQTHGCDGGEAWS